MPDVVPWSFCCSTEADGRADVRGFASRAGGARMQRCKATSRIGRDCRFQPGRTKRTNSPPKISGRSQQSVESSLRRMVATSLSTSRGRGLQPQRHNWSAHTCRSALRCTMKATSSFRLAPWTCGDRGDIGWSVLWCADCEAVDSRIGEGRRVVGTRRFATGRRWRIAGFRMTGRAGRCRTWNS